MDSCYLFCLLALTLWSYTSAVRDSSFRFRVPAGWYECFYQDFDVQKDARLELMYEVIQGGGLDIKISVYDTEDMPVVVPELQRSGRWDKINRNNNGPYKICLDNTFSHISDKVVFLQIIIHELVDTQEQPLSDKSLDDSATNILHQFLVIGRHLSNVTMHQHHQRSREARHKWTAESNERRVFIWSLVETVALVAVFIAQVIIIRSLFRSGSKRSDGIRT